MRFANSITELVGNTPLVRLTRVIDPKANLVLAKLEQFNPCGSVKDRAALSMIDEARERGVLPDGGTIIEATSGNTGIALAFIAAARGYTLIVVMPDAMSFERRKLFGLFGARVELTQAHRGMQGAIDRARALADEIPGSFLVDQFHNEANALAHERTTAEEILEATDGAVDIVVAGVGTGGTITGLGRRLKRHNPGIRIIAVEPDTCAVLSGGAPGQHMIQGIGAGFVPAILDRSVVDEVVRVSDTDALKWARDLVRREGILCGISAGAAARGANQYLRTNGITGSTVVVIFPDTGERYLSISLFASGA